MKYNFLAVIALSFLVIFCLTMWLLFPVVSMGVYLIMAIFLGYAFYKAPLMPEDYDNE